MTTQVPLGLIADGAFTADTAGRAKFAAGFVNPSLLAQPLTAMTVTASTSGTFVDFLSIPAWARRVTVMFNGVSTNGTSQPMIQIGTSGGVQTTGYSTNTTSITSGANATTNYTNGWQLYSSLAASTVSGALTLMQLDAGPGLWVGTGLFSVSTPGVIMTAGTKSLSGTLDRVRVTTAGGTDAFDAGSINVIYD